VIAIGTVGENEIEATAALIRAAFAPVARLFDLTAWNCPTHPSLATAETVTRSIDHGTRFLAARDGDGRILGVVGARPPRDGLVVLEKLAVSPAFQGRGIGGALLDRARIQSAGAGLEVSIIDEHLALAAWYERRGFQSVRRIRPAGLPFVVRILICPVDASRP